MKTNSKNLRLIITRFRRLVSHSSLDSREKAKVVSAFTTLIRAARSKNLSGAMHAVDKLLEPFLREEK